MKLIKLLYKKYFLSLSICLITSYVIFFIFSLIGNLNDGYLFNIIIKLSILNSLQILAYVPTFIFLISIVLFTIFLRSKNEIIIIKTYLSIKKILIFIFPIILIFTTLEINKKNLVQIIENNKEYLINQDNTSKVKILVNDYSDFKEITILQNFDPNNIHNSEFRSYKIVNDKLEFAEYSNNLNILNNKLLLKNYTQYKNNIIKDFNTQKQININFINLFLKKTLVKNLSNEKYFKVNLSLINLILFFMLFLNYIFFSFFNKKFVSTKHSLKIPTFMCLLILIYSFVIFNNSLNIYRHEFEFLSSLVVGMFLLKFYLNE